MRGTHCIYLVLMLATGTALGGESSLLNEYTIRRWAIEDGLPETVITSVQQLPDGYLWCTTPRYLLRFDGVRFVVVGRVSGGAAPPGIAAGAYRTNDGTLWWYGSAGALRNDGKEWLPVDFPKMLALGEADGQLWAATGAGMRWWDGHAFRGEGSAPPVTTADVDNHGRFWLAAAGKLMSFYDGKLETSEFPGDNVSQVSVSPAGEFWVLTTTGLFCRRDKGWQAVALPVPARQVTSLLVDDDATLWLGTGQSLFRWRDNNWSDLTAREGLFPWDVRCLSLDDEGNVWVGTSGGLVRLHRKSLTVIRTGRPQGSESVTAFLAESSTNIWIGVPDGGLLAGVPGALRLVWPKRLAAGTTVSAICRGHDGTLWVGTQADGLWRCRPDGSVTMVPGEESTPQGVTAILEDRRGHLWVGTWDGLLTLNGDGDLVPAGITSIPDTVHTLFSDRIGRVWVGFQSLGLACLSPGGTVRQYRKSDGLPGDSVRAILEDEQGTLWIGTSSGLARWAGNRKSIFTTANGLVDDVILQLLEDDDEHLWLGTRRGIMRVKKSEFAEVAAGRKAVIPIRQFNVDAGMADAECSGGMGARPARTEDGRLWFPTQDGLVVVDPRHLPPEVAKPKVYIEEILAKGQSVYQMPITMATEPLHIRLPRGARDLEFHVTTPVFSMPESAHFKYELEGQERNWSRATVDRSVRYEDLSPGTYRFRVMARDRDGEWNEAAQVVQLAVVPFVWETIWFRVAVGLLGVFIVVAVVHVWDKRRSAWQMKELERRHAIERERARIARDIHDDVGAGLTEMAMLSELARGDAESPGESGEHLDRIFRRSRELARSLDEIVWAINPANDTLESFLSYVSEFAQEFLLAAGMACRLELPSNPPAQMIGSHVRHHLCLAIREALHNAVKHAGASEVHLRVELTGRTLRITIQDNGRGFPAGAQFEPGVGRDGLSNLRDRLAEIGGSVVYESAPGEGTRAVLTVELVTAAASAGAPS